ncbi:MAG TPA: hypothetical protein VI700_04970 [Thermoanaerobaculaceae bacterium]|nr:hypothetical protein [Thermoanaerobaculaceae bacterium]
MLKEFAQYLVALARPQTVKVEGRTYATEQLTPVKDPLPAALVVATLTGLVEYLVGAPPSPEVPADDGTVHVGGPRRFSLGEYDVRGLVPATTGNLLAVHVADPGLVDVVSTIGGAFVERPVLARAVSPNRCQFRFNSYLPQEEFIIGLLAGFVLTREAQPVLAVAGNLTAESTVNLLDDGVSQTASLREGVQRLAAAQVPSPVMLRPYRTFPEIEQPESPFVFRVSKGQDNAPRCGLFPVLTEAWRLEAVDSIVAWLRERLPADVRVIG